MDLSTEVVENILSARAAFTRKLHVFKWRFFPMWCKECHLDPINCPLGKVLEFLKDCFSAGLTPFTVKMYVAAISASHIPIGGASLGRHPLVSRFLRKVRCLRPFYRSSFLGPCYCPGRSD